jgi:hypothetical protein
MTEQDTPFYTIYTNDFTVVVDEEDFNGVELIQELVERYNPETIDAEWLDATCQVEYGLYDSAECEHVYIAEYLGDYFKKCNQ